jgi:alginate O-acetyltransferase complex protein AlgI
MAIADGVARTASAVFAPGASVTWVDVLAGTFFYAVQLYADFSGYSDMAIGVASLLGIDLTTNFRFPYLSRNAAEFWQRWHISLSTWFRDYVFFPLGGPAGGPRRWIRNVMVTFFVTGLWHGAAWTYVLWGCYHGVLLCLHRGAESLARAWNRPQGLLPRPLAVALFFPVICYGWVLFRAESLSQVASLTGVLLRLGGGAHLTASLPLPSALFGLPVFALMEWAGSRPRGRALHEALPVPAWTAAYAVMLFAIAMGSGAAALPFAYFVF